MSAITTHLLDAVLGKPASGILVDREKLGSKEWAVIGGSITDGDGRCRDLPNASQGRYRLTFAVAAYFAQLGRTSIYPEITVTFLIKDEEHYHIPLLLCDNSYTTYRGS